MPNDRFFFEQDLKENEAIFVENKEFHHLVNVMRAKVNDHMEVVNGKGDLAVAHVQAIEKRKAILFVEKVTHEPQETFQVVLAQAIPRPNRLDFILEKGTELGMTEIWLFPAELGEKKDFSENQLERMRQILIAAMKQCGRLYLPKLVFKPKLTGWKDLPFPAFFGDVEEGAKPFLDVWTRKENGIIFFIGPESGLSDKEVIALKQLQATGVKLNANILRTDTAAIAALALIGSAD